MSLEKKNEKVSLSLSLAALGIVFGDIGTSPLYALKECFFGHHPLPINEGTILGILSFLIWSLFIIISIKYVAIVMKANNNGEGGILALTALISRKLAKKNSGRNNLKKIFLFLGIFGTALLYADGMITPAISVLSALEGLVEVTPSFEPYITLLAVIVLILLFSIQQKGTGTIGKFFGPLTLTWFITIGALGIVSIIETPIVLKAINPWYAANFFYSTPKDAFFSLGSLFLAVTGAEALYADMGHFGLKPIARAWQVVVMPCLAINYLGQGGVMFRSGAAVRNPFYELAPSWGLVPLVILATLVSVIASQAIITGAFSMTKQGIQLGILPRMRIDYTSVSHEGQIYIPAVSRFLAIGTIILVISFGSSSSLAAAYGIGVSMDMLITTCLLFLMAKKVWRWNIFILVPFFLFFAILDTSFVAANSIKFFDGGWFTLLVSFALFMVMTTWARGRELLGKRLQEKGVSWEKFKTKLKAMEIQKVPGTAIFMTKSNNVTPAPLIHNVEHNKVIHELVLLMTIEVERVPYVNIDETLIIDEMGDGIYRVTAHCGFQDEPDVKLVVESCKRKGLNITDDITFFLGREILMSTEDHEMAPWRANLFGFMSRNAQRATSYYKVPSEQVFEVGIQVEL